MGNRTNKGKGAVALGWPGRRNTADVLGRSADTASRPRPLEHYPGDGTGPGMLFHGDNAEAAAALLGTHRGRLDLIYVDPPFCANAARSARVLVGQGNTPCRVDVPAYEDRWEGGLADYLDMLHPRLVLFRELLSDTGSLFVHVDWRTAGYVRVLLDEVFGMGAAAGGGPGFRNAIAWCYSGGGIPRNELPRKHDTVFWYTKTDRWTYNPVYRPYTPGTVGRGRTAVKGGNAALRPQGTPVCDWWADVKRIASPTDREKLYYPTQKSEELLARIISMCSDPGGLVADFFCGSGTTPAVAARLGRRWIAADAGALAVQVTRKRMLETGSLLERGGMPAPGFDVFRAGPEQDPDAEPVLEASARRTDDGRAVQVSIEGFQPVLPGPLRGEPDLSGHSKNAGFDYLELWSVDMAPGDTTKPHKSSWCAWRRGRDNLLADSVEIAAPNACPREVEILGVDVFGNRRVTRCGIDV
ncbi:MAG: DNA methyltransferase [Desulfatibacillaceae bacterium]